MGARKKRKPKDGIRAAAAKRRGRKPEPEDPEELLSIPVWEYRAHAQRLAAENSDLNADSILAAFLSIPVRLWDLEGRGISRVSAADLAGQPVSTVEELLDIFEVIHTGGFISWDEQSYAHYLSTPGDTEDTPIQSLLR